MPTDTPYIPADQLDDVLKPGRERRATLAETLIRRGLATEENVAELLSRQFGVPTINLTHFHCDPSAIGTVDPSIARKYNLVPVFKRGSTITIAVPDPTDSSIIDQIRAGTGCTSRSSSRRKATSTDSLPLHTAPQVAPNWMKREKRTMDCSNS